MYHDKAKRGVVLPLVLENAGSDSHEGAQLGFWPREVRGTTYFLCGEQLAMCLGFLLLREVQAVARELVEAQRANQKTIKTKRTTILQWTEETQPLVNLRMPLL